MARNLLPLEPAPKKGTKMRKPTPKTVLLGELILLVFDKAAQYAADPTEASLLASRTVLHMLRRMPRVKPSALRAVTAA
jgi:hypothetical protein